MARTPLLGTGFHGLVGSRFLKSFADVYEVDNLDISDPVRPIDITKLEELQRVFAASPAKYVLHCAAFTDVTKAWEQRDDKTGIAYQVNVVGTQNVVQAAAETGKHLIHISTAYVFDGNKKEMYVESDPMSPIEWYGQTKAWAEEKVTSSPGKWTILRIDQPFRSDPFPRKDAVHRIIDGLKNNTLYPQFTNHYFGPTYLNDFVKVMDWVMRTNTTGLFHATAGEQWTDLKFAEAIQNALHLEGEVRPGDLNAYLETLSRPYQCNTALSSEKLKSLLDFKLASIAEALQQIEVSS